MIRASGALSVPKELAIRLMVSPRTVLAVYLCLFPYLGLNDALGQTRSASISGTVVGDNGQPVSAVVTALKLGLPVGTGRADSAADGSFSIKNLPDGTYNMCVADKAGIYLDPCAWSSAQFTVTITAKASASGYKLVVTKGSPLQVRMNDANQVLQATAVAPNRRSASLVAAVVTARHTLQPLIVISKDTGGQSLQTMIPVNQTVSLALFGKGVAVADASGRPLDVANSTRISVQATSNQIQVPVTLTVTPAAQ